MAAFPVAANVPGAGATSLDDSDSRKPKQAKRSTAEVWLPIWARFFSLSELKRLLLEGRATVGGRMAATGTDMAREICEMGRVASLCLSDPWKSEHTRTLTRYARSAVGCQFFNVAVPMMRLLGASIRQNAGLNRPSLTTAGTVAVKTCRRSWSR